MLRKFDLTATASVEMRVVASSEDEARQLVRDLLHQSDTDFIRTDHWPAEKIIAEFALSDVRLKDALS